MINNIELTEQFLRDNFPTEELINSAKIKPYVDVIFQENIYDYLSNVEVFLIDDTLDLLRLLWVNKIYQKMLLEITFQLKNGGVVRVSNNTFTQIDVQQLNIKIKSIQKYCDRLHERIKEAIVSEQPSWYYKPFTKNIGGWNQMK